MTLASALQFGAAPWALLQRLFAVAALLLGVAVAFHLDDGRIPARLRERFVYGVPWGTLVVVSGVLAVYLFLQGGYWHWYRPLVIPFRAWSYFEPLGMLVGGFAHAGPGHLLGNLFGALTLAPIVEYTIGHYPPESNSATDDPATDDPATDDPATDDPATDDAPDAAPSTLRERLDALSRDPWGRALVLFPLGVAVVGVVLTLFTIGAVVGFSGVVFAFAGVALVRYPLATVLALVASDLLNVLYNAIQHPTTVASGRSTFVTPWWADIAIQGHAIGLLAGVVLCTLLLRRREEALPSPTRLWTGVLLVATSQSLWAVYWYRGSTEYVLFRAIGLGLVAVGATVVVVAVAGPERPLWPFATDAAGAADDGGAGVDDAAGDHELRVRDLSVAQIGMVALVLVAALVSGPAVAVNLVAAESGPPGDPVDVGGYEITYAEGVQDGMVSAVPFTAFGETTRVPTSGVIVANPDRQIWHTAVPKGRLAANGRATVIVGGVGWRASVTASRRGWTAVGGATAYRVVLAHDGERRTAYTSGAAQADPQIAGQNVSVVAGNESFHLLVSEGNETVRRPLPTRNESVTVRNVTYRGTGDRVVARHDGTRVTVLRVERYN